MSTIYEVLRRPIITEKSNYQSAKLNQYVFEVAGDATRTMVKDAVELIFDVKVTSVNIMNMVAKRSRNRVNRRMRTRRPEYRKAIVTLAPGDSIEAFEGVK
ncbi:MAG: 50S ribosomal protein L23 [Anaerolineales bacterium]